MIVLDTHILVWLISTPEKLSPKAQKTINNEIKRGKQLLVSSMSVWEICLLVKKGKLKLPSGLDAWFDKLEQFTFLQFIPVDNKIAAKSVNLPGKFHDDPADRIIIATACEYGVKLATADKRILKYRHVQSVW